MGFVSSSPSFSNVKTFDDLSRYSSMVIGDIVAQINGKIGFVNLQKQVIPVNFTAANIEVQIPHNLGYVPNGYYQIGANAATQVYNTTESTANFLFLKSSAIATVKVYVF